MAVSLARAVRNPALEELYFFGPHVGNFAFEIGNAESRRREGARLRRLVPLALRARVRRGQLVPQPHRQLHLPQSDRRGDEEDGLPVIAFTGADSVLQGVEAHTDIEISPPSTAEVGLDYVRGTLRATDEPLPRIPPLRFTAGARYRWNALQAGGEVVVAAKQDRVFGAETPTDGYGAAEAVRRLLAAAGQALHTFTARLDNATNETYYNHLSFIKDFVPEMGRNFKVVYGVTF